MCNKNGKEYADDFLITQELQHCLRVFPLDVPGWEMREVLHNGDNAVIFLAENTQGLSAVIKRFKLDVRGVNHTRVEHFLLGCSALRFLGEGQHLVHLLDAGINDQALYLIMEYVPGDTLKNHLAAPTLPPLTQRLRWFDELVGVLGYVHSIGLLHRDLKTSNILVRENGSLALLDFGLETGVLVEAGFLQANEIYCTPYYVSPERILGEMADERSDLYALGVILHELLLGHKPYESIVLSELLKQHILAPVPRLPPAYLAYQPLINGLLAKSPEDRFPSAAEVTRLLRTISKMG